MGNNNKALETPKNANQIQANQHQCRNPNLKLYPITFESLGPQDNSNIKQKQQTRQPITPSKFTNLSTRIQSQQPTLIKTSGKSSIEINLNTLGVINKHHQIQSSLREPITAPFEVVKLTLEKELLQTIKQCDPQFVQQLQKLKTKWQLTPKGFYASRYEKNISIIKSGNIYQGEYLQEDDNIIPNGQGKLIKKEGIFKGEFNNGNAHGLGCFYDRLKKAEYKGFWRNGVLTKGQIEREDFIFSGKFQNNVANGEGIITFVKQNSSYKGIFIDGVYQDDNGYFQSDIYAYSGGFRRGQKHGEGCLIEKERNIKSIKKSNSKYHPQKEYQGFFQSDAYIGKKNYALRTHS